MVLEAGEEWIYSLETVFIRVVDFWSWRRQKLLLLQLKWLIGKAAVATTPQTNIGRCIVIRRVVGRLMLLMMNYNGRLAIGGGGRR